MNENVKKFLKGAGVAVGAFAIYKIGKFAGVMDAVLGATRISDRLETGDKSGKLNTFSQAIGAALASLAVDPESDWFKGFRDNIAKNAQEVADVVD